jgi:hypothetical protein
MNTAFTPRTCPICNIIYHIMSAHRNLVDAEDCKRDGRMNVSGLLLSSANNHRISAASMFDMKIGSK